MASPSVAQPAAPSLINFVEQLGKPAPSSTNTTQEAQSFQASTEEKGIGRRLIDCISEFGAIIRDIGIMIFHFFTFGCFRKEASPVPSASTPSSLMPSNRGPLNALESLQFFGKRNHLMTLMESPEVFEQRFFQLYAEYPQGAQRESLVKDFVLYTIKRFSLGLSQGAFFSSEDIPFPADIAESLRNEREPLLSSLYYNIARHLYKAVQLGSSTAYAEMERLAQVYCEVKTSL